MPIARLNMYTTTTPTTTLTQAETEAAFVGGMVGGIIAASIIAAFICAVIMVIANYKIFKKAGEKGWKAIIPIYNIYIMYKIVGMKKWFWGIIAVSFIGTIILSLSGVPLSSTSKQIEAQMSNINMPIVCIVVFATMAIGIYVSILYAIRTARAFHKSNWFAIGLLFFSPIFWFILAIDDAKYDKKRMAKYI